MKKTIWQILFEFLSIVFAVLLALGLNAYKESLDLNHESKTLREKIIKEVKRNKLEIDSVITVNTTYMAYLDSLLSLDEELESFQLSIASELMASSSWKFTQSAKSFTHIDSDFLDDATELYEQQDFYMLISNQMFQNLGDMLLLSDKSDKMVVTSHYYMSNILQTAESLRDNYETFVKTYDQVSDAPSE